MSADVATVGDNCIDRYLPPVGLSMVGGNAVNVAVHLRRRGLGTTYLGAVGRDAAGRRIVTRLSENGVATDRICERKEPTAWTDIAMGPDGERIVVLEEFGACRPYRPTVDDMAMLRRVRHVHIGWLDDDGACRRQLAASGVSVSQDLAVNPGAAGLAVAFASAGPCRERAAALRDAALAEGAGLVVVTMGALGSLVSDGTAQTETDIAPVAVLDTLGAGDTFIAAFLARRLDGGDPGVCLRTARNAAAETCRHWGGFSQLAEALLDAGAG